MRLLGQNLRVLLFDSATEKYHVVAMATSCTINLTNNTQESQTKDDVGLASKPEIVSKAWSVQVESMNVSEMGMFLTAIKSMTPMKLMWDKVNTTNNQAPTGASFARTGMAYLSDCTFNFNDRENSTSSLQFTGCTPLETIVSPSYATSSVSAYTKGQFVRLFISDIASPANVIAGAKTLSLHISLSLESKTSKDTEGTFDVQEPTGLSYDISTNALVESGESITSEVQSELISSMMDYYDDSDLLYWQIANVSGDNNRTKGNIICSGQCQIASLAINAAVKQAATYDASLVGYGPFTIGA